MRSRDEFTWDYIIEACQRGIDYLTQTIGQDPARTYQGQENYRRGYEALILAVEELRKHPQLATDVPMMSLASLRWFPRKLCEVQVYYMVSKLQYQVAIYLKDKSDPHGVGNLVEERYVYLSKLADTVVSFIEKSK